MRLGVSIRPSRLASSPTHFRIVRNASSASASLIADLPPPEAPSRFSSLSAMAQSSLFAPQKRAPSPFMRCRRILKGGPLSDKRQRSCRNFGKVGDAVHHLSHFIKQF